MFYKKSPIHTSKRPLRLVSLLVAAVLIAQDAAAGASLAAAQAPRAAMFRASDPYRIPASVAWTGALEPSRSPVSRGLPASVILIEDAHTNPSGQMNLAKALETVTRHHAVSTVFTEGADGDVSLTELRRRGTPRERARALLPFVRRGEIKGSELLQISGERPFSIVGVEDRSLYEEAVRRYAEASGWREMLLTAIDRLDGALDAVAEIRFATGSPAARFRSARTAYRDGGMTAADYFSSLIAEAEMLGAAPADSRQLERFIRLRELERGIDFDQVRKDWAAAVAALPEEERELLEGSSVGSVRKDGLGSHVAAGERLRRAMSGRPMPGELRKYLSYLRAAGRLEFRELLDQIEQLELRVESRSALTPVEAGILRSDRHLARLRAMAGLELDSRGFAELEAAGPDAEPERIAAFLNRQILETGAAPERAVLREHLKLEGWRAAREFYRIAFRRDEAMVTRLERAASDRNETHAILIIGGFHTAHLKELLSGRGISVRVLTPQVYEPTDRLRYEKLLLTPARSDEGPVVRGTRSPSGSDASLITRYAAESPGILRSVKRALEDLPVDPHFRSETSSASPIDMSRDPRPSGSRLPSLPELPNGNILAVSALDLAAEVPEDPRQPIVIRDGFRKLEQMLASAKKMGMGRIYLYGSASHGELTRQVHTRQDPAPEVLFAPDGRSAVLVSGYVGGRRSVGGRELTDAEGNFFSVKSLSEFHPGMGAPGDSAAQLDEKFRRLTAKAAALGISIITDFIAWRAPDAVDSSNYKGFFYLEQPADWNRRLNSEDEAGKRRMIDGLLRSDRTGSSAARIRGADGAERVVRVRRLRFYGIDSGDQVIPNPYHPLTHRYYVDSLKRMVDLGIGGVRVDLGFMLLPDEMKHYFIELGDRMMAEENALVGGDYERRRDERLAKWLKDSGADIRRGEGFGAWWNRRNAGSMPWRQIISEVETYAMEQGKRFDFFIETYEDRHRNELSALGVSGNYQGALFEALAHRKSSLEIARAARSVIDNRPREVGYGSNFDQNSLNNIGRSIPAVWTLLALMGHNGALSMTDLRDLGEDSGQVIRIVGGNPSPRDPHHHPFVNEQELRRRQDPSWTRKVLHQSPWAEWLRQVRSRFDDDPIREIHLLTVDGLGNESIHNSSDRNRYLPVFFRTRDRWYLAVLDFAPGNEAPKESEAPLKIELPARGALPGYDPERIRNPRVLMGRGRTVSAAVGSWYPHGLSPRTVDLTLAKAPAGGPDDRTSIVELGPADAPDDRLTLTAEHFFERKNVHERIGFLELARGEDHMPRDEMVRVLRLGLIDPHFLVRGTAANMLAGRHRQWLMPRVLIREWLDWIHDPLAVLNEVPPRQEWPHVGPFFNTERARRNGRYAILHALRHLAVQLDARTLRRSDRDYADWLLRGLRADMEDEVPSWTEARDKALREQTQWAIRAAIAGHTDPQQDAALGFMHQMTLLQTMRMAVMRSEEIAKVSDPGIRDTFYWVLDSVKALVPDVPGDPVADVVWRGRPPSAEAVAPSGARMNYESMDNAELTAEARRVLEAYRGVRAFFGYQRGIEEDLAAYNDMVEQRSRYMAREDARISHFALRSHLIGLLRGWETNKGSTQPVNIPTASPSFVIREAEARDLALAAVVDEARELIRETRPGLRLSDRFVPIFWNFMAVMHPSLLTSSAPTLSPADLRAFWYQFKQRVFSSHEFEENDGYLLRTIRRYNDLWAGEGPADSERLLAQHGLLSPELAAVLRDAKIQAPGRRGWIDDLIASDAGWGGRFLEAILPRAGWVSEEELSRIRDFMKVPKSVMAELSGPRGARMAAERRDDAAWTGDGFVFEPVLPEARVSAPDAIRSMIEITALLEGTDPRQFNRLKSVLGVTERYRTLMEAMRLRVRWVDPGSQDLHGRLRQLRERLTRERRSVETAYAQAAAQERSGLFGSDHTADLLRDRLVQIDSRLTVLQLTIAGMFLHPRPEYGIRGIHHPRIQSAGFAQSVRGAISSLAKLQMTRAEGGFDLEDSSSRSEAPRGADALEGDPEDGPVRHAQFQWLKLGPTLRRLKREVGRAVSDPGSAERIREISNQLRQMARVSDRVTADGVRRVVHAAQPPSDPRMNSVDAAAFQTVYQKESALWTADVLGRSHRVLVTRTYKDRAAFERGLAQRIPADLRIQAYRLNGWILLVRSLRVMLEDRTRLNDHETRYVIRSIEAIRDWAKRGSDPQRQAVGAAAAGLLENLSSGSSNGGSGSATESVVALEEALDGMIRLRTNRQGIRRHVQARARRIDPGSAGARMAQGNELNGDDDAFADILREIEILPTLQGWPAAVTVFGSARIMSDNWVYQHAVHLGRELARSGFAARTGGGPSIMEAVLEGMMDFHPDQHRLRQAIRIQLPFEERTTRTAGLVQYFNRFLTRKRALHENTIALAAYPGGIGTIDEFFESWRRGRPLALMIEDFWRPFIEALLSSWCGAGLISQVTARNSLPFMTDHAHSAIDFVRNNSLLAPYRGNYMTPPTDIPTLVRELTSSRSKLRSMSEAVTFVGKPAVRSAALDQGIRLGEMLWKNRVHVRVLSEGALHEGLVGAADNRTRAELLQTVLFRPPVTLPIPPGTRRPHEASKRSIVVRDESIHQFLTASHSSAFVFLPGGVGTMNRLFDIVQIMQVNKVPIRPILLMGRTFWGPIVQSLEQIWLRSEGVPQTVSPKDMRLFTVVDRAEEAMEILRGSVGARMSAAGEFEGDDAAFEDVLRELGVLVSLSGWQPAVTVFGSARIPADNWVVLNAVEFGRQLARAGYAARTGGGPSIMEAILKGMAEELPGQRRNRQAIGIELPYEAKITPYAGIVQYFNRFITRKRALHENTIALVAYPGGIGTADELFESWRRGRPLALVVEDFWRPLIEVLLRSWKMGGIISQVEPRKVLPFITDHAQSAIDHVRNGEILSGYFGQFATGPQDMGRVIQDLKTGRHRLRNLNEAVTFAGRPSARSKEFKEGMDLAERIWREGGSIRVVSEGTLNSALLAKVGTEKSKRSKLLQLLLASTSMKPSDRAAIQAAPVRRGNVIEVADESNQQFLMSMNTSAFVFFPGGVGTMNRLFDVIQPMQEFKAPVRPVILVGSAFWGPIISTLETMWLKTPGVPQLVKPDDMKLFRVVDTAEEAFAILEKSAGARLSDQATIGEAWNSSEAHTDAADDPLIDAFERSYGEPASVLSEPLIRPMQPDPRATFRLTRFSPDGKDAALPVVWGDMPMALLAPETASYARYRPVVYARIGEWRFIDSRLKERMEKLPEYGAYAGQIIYLHDMKSSLTRFADNLQHFAVPMISALQELPMEGETFIDAGSADGVLSLLALKKGASVILIDLNPAVFEAFQKHLAVNGIDPSRARFIEADLRETGKLAEAISRIDGMKPAGILSANIGHHPDIYPIKTMRAAAELGRRIPSVHTVVAGGDAFIVPGSWKAVDALGPSSRRVAMWTNRHLRRYQRIVSRLLGPADGRSAFRWKSSSVHLRGRSEKYELIPASVFVRPPVTLSDGRESMSGRGRHLSGSAGSRLPAASGVIPVPTAVFLRSVTDAHPAFTRAHLAVDGKNGSETFRLWRRRGDGAVFVSRFGAAGRIGLRKPGAPRTPARPFENEGARTIGAEAAVARDLELAERLLKIWPGDPTLRVNVELDRKDLIRISAHPDPSGLEVRLERARTAAESRGIGRMLFRDEVESGTASPIPGAPTVRLYRQGELAYAAQALPGQGPPEFTVPYLQAEDQMLPVLSSSLFSAMMAASSALPSAERAELLKDLSPVYRSLTGDTRTLTAELVDAPASDPDALHAIRPLTLSGYLAVTLYLQELSRRTATVSA